MSAVLIASITELCTADHQGKPEVIAGWTRNKSEAGVRAMLDHPGTSLFVAEIDGTIAAVGATLEDGAIGLNYVAPACRFQGASRALLDHMETALRDAGFAVAQLNSTTTAHRFYQEAGWIDAGEPRIGFTLVGYPMRKVL